VKERSGEGEGEGDKRQTLRRAAEKRNLESNPESFRGENPAFRSGAKGMLLNLFDVGCGFDMGTGCARV